MAITLDTFRAAISSSSIQGSENISVTEDWSGNRQISVVKGKGDALDTRRVLLDALNQRFGKNIPKSVLKAMNVSKAFSGFSVDKNGEVKASNHPLSARRLQTILKAIDNETVNKAAQFSHDVKQLCQDRGISMAHGVFLATYCYNLGDQLGTERGRGKVEDYCKTLFRGTQSDEQIKSLVKALTELPQRAKAEIKAKNDGFTIVEMTEFRQDDVGAVPKDASQAEVGMGEFEIIDDEKAVEVIQEYNESRGEKGLFPRNQLAVRQNISAFEVKYGMKLSAFEKRAAIQMVNAGVSVDRFDLSVSKTSERLQRRIDDLRNGEIYGASEGTMRLVTAMMYSNPKLKPQDVRCILKMAQMCREQIAPDATDGKTPAKRLHNMARAVGKTIVEEFGALDARLVKTEKCEWNIQAAFPNLSPEDQAKMVDNETSKLGWWHSDASLSTPESNEMASLLVYVLLSENRELAADVKNLSFSDVAQIRADFDLQMTETRVNEDVADNRKHMKLIMEGVKHEGKTNDRMGYFDDLYNQLPPDKLEELRACQRKDVEMFIESLFLHAVAQEASSRFDAGELERASDALIKPWMA